MTITLPLARIYGVLAAVLCHEAGHVLAGRLCGAGIRAVNVMPFGVSFDMDAPPSYVCEAVTAAAGPLVNLIICVLICADIFPKTDALRELFIFSAALGALNLLPVRSLDGGNIAVALLSLVAGRERAERVVSVVGTATLVFMYLIAVYIFFYGARNFSLLTFVSAMFFITVVKGDPDFTK